METISARCLLCSKTYSVDESHKDYKKLVAQEKPVATFICDLCNFRVKHESEEKNKPKKPM
ncbi:MAG: DUF2197 domain-containing protein [Syntrophomonadaceae bacterium]|jgi:uncharacterized protein YlaI|nr:DUF2197 domain-containing protein [Syntrophomonadaceae bacterium]